MKTFLKENLIGILLALLLGLLFLLWGRMIVREMRLNTYIHDLTTQEARLNCLTSYGWTCDPGSEARRTALIPDPLDAVYQKYNRLQTPCGFNLERYRGKLVECYTYQIMNFPYETHQPVFANLLIYEGSLIGGDIMSTALDGFMLPLDRKFLP